MASATRAARKAKLGMPVRSSLQADRRDDEVRLLEPVSSRARRAAAKSSCAWRTGTSSGEPGAALHKLLQRLVDGDSAVRRSAVQPRCFMPEEPTGPKTWLTLSGSRTVSSPSRAASSPPRTFPSWTRCARSSLSSRIEARDLQGSEGQLLTMFVDKYPEKKTYFELSHEMMEFAFPASLRASQSKRDELKSVARSMRLRTRRLASRTSAS